MNKCYVYALSDPQTGVRYVGKTGRSLELRLQEHLRVARVKTDKGKSKYRQHLYTWIRSLETPPTIELIEEFDSEPLSLEGECFYIAYFRSLGFNLVNHSEGGNGWTMGIKRPPDSLETRLKKSRSHTGVKRGAAFSKKMSAVISGVPKSNEHRINLARAKGSRAIIHVNSGTRYETINEASRALGLYHQEIGKILLGKRNHTKGNRFVYAQ